MENLDLSPKKFWKSDSYKDSRESWVTTINEYNLMFGTNNSIKTNSFLQSKKYHYAYALWKYQLCGWYLRQMEEVESPSLDQKIRILQVMKYQELANNIVKKHEGTI